MLFVGNFLSIRLGFLVVLSGIGEESSRGFQIYQGQLRGQYVVDIRTELNAAIFFIHFVDCCENKVRRILCCVACTYQVEIGTK